MLRRVWGRVAAGFCLLLLAIVCDPVAACAQWQLGVSAAAVEPSRAVPIQTVAEPFGLAVVPLTFGEILGKWSDVEAEIRAESGILAQCRVGAQSCPAAAQKFLAVIAEGRARQGLARIGVINRAINLSIRPTSDLAQWGVPDRWSAPLETLSTGRGDCEDYAIAKYVALREAGTADDDVRLVIVRDLAIGEDHAVVAARLGGRWIVLDNRWLALVADRDLPRMVPLFVLDRQGVKQFAPAMVQAGHAAPATAAPGAL